MGVLSESGMQTALARIVFSLHPTLARRCASRGVTEPDMADRHLRGGVNINYKERTEWQ
jgi:hypothetical protein